MNDQEKKYEALSYCGIDCSICCNFHQNMNCSGCRKEKKLLEDCPVRKCGMAKELLYCGQCRVFPCDMLEEFYSDGSPLHHQAFENIKIINNDGVDQWLLKRTCGHSKKREG